MRVVPVYATPHYSIKKASRDLGDILPGHGTIATMRAEGLFNENEVRYKSFFRVNWPVEKPDVLVIGFWDVETLPWIKQDYHLMKRYEISVSPEYQPGRSNLITFSTGKVKVSVYKKNERGVDGCGDCRE
jgi:hypothetical protein